MGVGTLLLERGYAWLLHVASLMGISGWLATVVAVGLAFAGLLLVSMLVYYLARAVVLRGFTLVARRTATRWDDMILHRRVFHHLCNLVPGAVWLYAVPRLFPDELESVVTFARVLVSLYMVFVTLRAVNAFLNAAHDIYQLQPVAQTRTIKPYIQVGQIVVYFVGGIIMVSIVLDRNPVSLFLGLGAMAAVLMLVFKDAILGLVASIQASANNIVKPGDWIVVPSRNADGTVLEITLTTVKVQNWDRTIATFPTYALINESVANWKGMSESSGRRIRMAIVIDMRTIHLCSPEEMARFARVPLLRDYIASQQARLDGSASPEGGGLEAIPGGEAFTNLGMFRHYVESYLRQHPDIDANDTCMARILNATSKGIPLELYCFCREKAWVVYEGVQSQVMEHLYSVLPGFGLRVHQDMTGSDMQLLLRAVLEGAQREG